MSDLITTREAAILFKEVLWGVTWNDRNRPNDVGSPWMNNADIDDLTEAVSTLINLFWNPKHIKQHKGPMPSAVQVVEDLMANMGTCVLATVMVAAWRETWLLAVVQTIVKGYGTCGTLNLHAVKGGKFIDAPQGTPWEERPRISQCDCEIFLVLRLMARLPQCELVEDGYVNSDLGCTSWAWKVARPDGAEPYYVYLTVWHSAADINTDALSDDMLARESFATVPSLSRVSVVSSPVETLDGERVDQLLNAKLLEAMELAKKDAEKNGFD